MPVQNVALIVLLSHNTLLGGMVRAEPSRKAGDACIVQRDETRAATHPMPARDEDGKFRRRIGFRLGKERHGRAAIAMTVRP